MSICSRLTPFYVLFKDDEDLDERGNPRKNKIYLSFTEFEAFKDAMAKKDNTFLNFSNDNKSIRKNNVVSYGKEKFIDNSINEKDRELDFGLVYHPQAFKAALEILKGTGTGVNRRTGAIWLKTLREHDKLQHQLLDKGIIV